MVSETEPFSLPSSGVIPKNKEVNQRDPMYDANTLRLLWAVWSFDKNLKSAL